ncbi:serine hydrolase, partial [Klebsiella quasipneumoniae]
MLLALLLISGCSGTLSQMSPPSNETSLTGRNGQRLSVDDYVRHYMREKQVSGMVVAIIHHNGPAEFHCFGVTDDQH